jgi:hypothetical protein
MIKKKLYCHLILLFLSLPSLSVASENLAHVLTPKYKTEVKYLIPDLSLLPPDILEALKKGDEHPDILTRGFVIQEYLAVTRKNISNIYDALSSEGIPFGDRSQLDLFLIPGKTQEIRFMRKCMKEKGVVKEIYQIGIQGSGGIRNVKMETPENLNEKQMKKLKSIFYSFNNEINDIVCKLSFEMIARDQQNRLLMAADGAPRTVEIDIFIKNHDERLIPFYINGEVKFREANAEQALVAAMQFREDHSFHPPFFGIDVSDKQGMKARNIALVGLPAQIADYFSDNINSNKTYTTSIAEQFSQWTSHRISSGIFNPPRKLVGFYLNKKVLLNAEPFGFGPSAAVAEMFPYLRNRVLHLSYIGTGHTLDLQSKLPYDEWYDYDSDKSTSRQDKFREIAKDYDIFITACDFEAAQWAKELGLTLIIYDPLTWYWPKVPEIVGKADYYVAQNFFGVAERLEREAGFFPEHAIVPAIISGIRDTLPQTNQKNLLVNLGGLSNPYLKQEDFEAYAKIVLGSSRDVLESEFDHTIYVTSKSIAQNVQEVCPVKTLQPYQVQKALSESKLALMTSGLGNIYEASSMQKKVVWLPPANDSQGQQIKLLQQHGMIDSCIDWSEIFEGEKPINYFDPQAEVLRQIAFYMQRLATDSQAQEKFKNLLRAASQKALREEPSALAELAHSFEVHGAKQASESIIQWIAHFRQ